MTTTEALPDYEAAPLEPQFAAVAMARAVLTALHASLNAVPADNEDEPAPALAERIEDLLEETR